MLYKKICDDVSVLEAGKVVEFGNAIELFARPQHPTTRKFLNTISQRNLSPTLIEQLNVSGSVIRLTFFRRKYGETFTGRSKQNLRCTAKHFNS